jgi:hydrogenase maturation protease
MLIIGYGNPHRGDDAAGILVAEQLRVFGVETTIHTGDALALIDLWKHCEQVTMIDTVVTGEKAGTIRNWNVDELLSVESRSPSTHGFGLAEAIRLARSLHCLPSQMCLYGIEGRRFEIGDPMSAEVKSAVKIVVRQIADTNP